MLKKQTLMEKFKVTTITRDKNMCGQINGVVALILNAVENDDVSEP